MGHNRWWGLAHEIGRPIICIDIGPLGLPFWAEIGEFDTGQNPPNWAGYHVCWTGYNGYDGLVGRYEGCDSRMGYDEDSGPL